jgi:ABC-type xylose transport system, periplasmic component
MRFKKLCVVLALAVAGAALPGGCARSYDNGHARDGKTIIGFSMDTLKEERWYKDRDEFVSDVKKLGGQSIVKIAYDSDAVQFAQVKQMLDEKIDVLVLIPHDAVSAARSVALAKQYGVKVISYDRLVRKADADLYVSFDNEKVGELMAAATVRAAPSGNYVIVNGPSSDYNTVMIDEGIFRILDPYIKKGAVRIVKQASAPDWMADEASDCILSLLRNNVRISAVIPENDALAGGVINTLSENRLASEVPVVGMDADLAACQRVAEGQQLMTVYKPISELALAAARFSIEMAQGRSIRTSKVISDGQYSVPYYAIAPIAVDKANIVSTVIKDNFHTLPEVYMNIPRDAWPSQPKHTNIR